MILDLEKDQEADEETEKGQLLQPTKGKDNKGNYTGAHSLRKQFFLQTSNKVPNYFSPVSTVIITT